MPVLKRVLSVNEAVRQCILYVSTYLISKNLLEVARDSGSMTRRNSLPTFHGGKRRTSLAPDNNLSEMLSILSIMYV